jgi:GTP-binding protein Era
MNAYLGQKIAIVTDKAQTTRSNLLGILTLPEAQVIFIDTPGLHQPHHLLGEYMVNAALQAIPQADLVLLLVDGSEPISRADERVAESLAELPNCPPILMAANKIDLLEADAVTDRLATYSALFNPVLSAPISAARGDNLDDLLDELIAILPEGPRFFPAEQVTDQHTRLLVAEFVREAALNLLRQEVPHALAVQVTEFKPRSEEMTYIAATIYVERDSQKKIVIGRGGKMLKKIGQTARPEIEALVESQVFLDLHVAVLPNWRKSDKGLTRFGFVLG